MFPKQFVLLPQYTHHGNVVFFGFGENSIIFNELTVSWHIIKSKDDDLFTSNLSYDGKRATTIGSFQLDKSIIQRLPVGTHDWNLMEECGKILPLKLTHVST